MDLVCVLEVCGAFVFWVGWVLVCCGFVVTMFSGIFLAGVLFCFCVWYLALILF